MKKFKDIRLMLVGLLCLMGVNAFAAIGDLQTDGTYWYQVSNEAKSEVYFAGLSIAATPTTKITIPAEVKLKNNLNNEITYTVVGVCKAGDASDGKWWLGTAEYTQDVAGVTEFTFNLVIDGVGTGNRNDWNLVVKPAIEMFAGSLETLTVTEARNISELPVLSNSAYGKLTSLNFGGVKNGGNAITLPLGFVFEQKFKTLVLPTEPLIAGQGAFAYVQGLKADGTTPQALNISTANILDFGKQAFFDANVQTITIGPKVANIGDEAFAADTDEKAFIQNVVWQSDKILPGVAPNLPYVRDAFAGQKNIASITVSGANIYSIAPGAFVDVTGPVVVNLSEATDLKSIENAFAPATPFKELYLKGTKLPADPDGKLSNIVDLTASQTTLKKLSLPESVKTLDPFTSFTALESIDMSAAQVTAIPANGFTNCISLKSIDLPAKTTSIGANAFQNTRLAGIVIPGEVTSIGAYAFADITPGATVYAPDGKTAWHAGFTLDLSGATKLSSVGIYAFNNTNVTGTVDFTTTAVKAIPEGAFYLIPSSITLGENGKFVSGTSGPVWNEKFALTEVKINPGKDKDNPATIGENAFRNNSCLAKADLNKSFLSTIAKGAFQNTALTEVNLKDTKVTDIKSSSFADNEALKTVTLNEGTTIIRKNAFDGDIALATVTNLGKSKLKTIEEYAFNGSAIDELDFSEATSLTTIGAYAFAQYYEYDASGNRVFAPALTAVTFPVETCTDPESVEDVFADKYSNKVQTIGNAAFLGASKLTKLANLNQCKLATLPQLFSDNDFDGTDRTNLKANNSSFVDNTPICPAGLKDLVLPSVAYDAKGEKFTTVSWASKDMATIALTDINDYALQGLGIEKIAIPATVTNFGACMLQGDLKLKKVEWYDAQQKKIHKYTFRGDTNLEEFYYMTANGPIKSKGITDDHFYWCSKEKLTVYVTSESLLQLLADGYTTANAKYSKLNDELTDEIEFTAKNSADNMYYRSYYNTTNATWIEANDNVKVYIAAVKGSKVEMTEADTENGYYKIKAYDGTNDGEAVCIIASATEKLTVELYGLPANNITTLQSKVNELECVDSDETASKLNFRFKFGKNSKTGQIGFFRVTSGTFKAGSVILKAKDPSRMQDFYPVSGDETGINTIEENINDNAPVYNLQGVRVNGTQKGIFIKNGKKFIVK